MKKLPIENLHQTKSSRFLLFTDKPSQWLCTKFLIIILSLVAVSACRPALESTPLPHTPYLLDASLTQEVPTNISTSETPPMSPEPVQETRLPTLTPTVIPSPTPILLSLPAFTNMGIELVGPNFVQHVPLASEAGVGWVRWNGLRWADIEPQEGVRNWDNASDLEVRAQAVSEADMNLIAIVHRTPAWAQMIPGYSCGPIQPDKLQAFGTFMYDLVARYSQPPYNVKYWEMGNEPDVSYTLVRPNQFFGCWGEVGDPYYGGGFYAEMLKAVYPQIKAADADAQVLVGGLLLDCDPVNPPKLESGETKDCTPARFLEGILLNDGGAYFDGVSFHAYDYYSAPANKYYNTSWPSLYGQGSQIPVSVWKSNYIRSLLSQFGVPDKFLINTETALLCGRDLKEPECRSETFEQTKANYVAQSFAVAKAGEFWGNIWYHYHQGWRASGLADGSLQSLPALDAYKFVATMLEGVQYAELIDSYEKVYGYKFIKSAPNEEKEIWILWTLDSSTVSITLPQRPDTTYDVFGNASLTGQVIEISKNPTYLEWFP